MRIQFKFLTGDMNWAEYGGKWYSQKFNNGEFDYCFVREILNWEDVVGEREKRIGKLPTYNVTVSVVAPEEFSDKDAALSCVGIESSWESLSWVEKVDAIISYAGGAVVFNKGGNNYKALFKEAKKETEISAMLFGFAMDRAQNRIGNTGWDRLKGDIGYKAKVEAE